jgi:hypothetical protein
MRIYIIAIYRDMPVRDLVSRPTAHAACVLAAMLRFSTAAVVMTRAMRFGPGRAIPSVGKAPAVATGAGKRAAARCYRVVAAARRGISLRAASILRSKSSRSAHGPALPITWSRIHRS